MKYILKLYIAGNSGISERAISHLKKLKALFPVESVDLEIIDVYLHPEIAYNDGILAIPTLEKVVPSPVRRVIGDLSDVEMVKHALFGSYVEDNME